MYFGLGYTNTLCKYESMIVNPPACSSKTVPKRPKTVAPRFDYQWQHLGSQSFRVALYYTELQLCLSESFSDAHRWIIGANNIDLLANRIYGVLAGLWLWGFGV